MGNSSPPPPPPPPTRNLEIEYSYYCFVTGMKQQSCPRLHQKQSEDLNSKIFLGRGEGGMPPAPPSRQACLLVCHTLLSSRYHPPPSPPPPLPTQNHPATTRFPPQLKIIPLPPSGLGVHAFICSSVYTFSHTRTHPPSHPHTHALTHTHT